MIIRNVSRVYTLGLILFSSTPFLGCGDSDVDGSASLFQAAGMVPSTPAESLSGGTGGVTNAGAQSANDVIAGNGVSPLPHGGATAAGQSASSAGSNMADLAGEVDTAGAGSDAPEAAGAATEGVLVIDEPGGGDRGGRLAGMETHGLAVGGAQANEEIGGSEYLVTGGVPGAMEADGAGGGDSGTTGGGESGTTGGRIDAPELGGSAVGGATLNEDAGGSERVVSGGVSDDPSGGENTPTGGVSGVDHLGGIHAGSDSISGSDGGAQWEPVFDGPAVGGSGGSGGSGGDSVGGSSIALNGGGEWLPDDGGTLADNDVESVAGAVMGVDQGGHDWSMVAGHQAVPLPVQEGGTAGGAGGAGEAGGHQPITLEHIGGAGEDALAGQISADLSAGQSSGGSALGGSQDYEDPAAAAGHAGGHDIDGGQGSADCVPGDERAHCLGAPECNEGDEMHGETPCGAGDLGTLLLRCEARIWQETAICVGTPVQGYLKQYARYRYAFDVAEGDQITVRMMAQDVSGMGLGWGTIWEGLVHVFDPDGQALEGPKLVYSNWDGETPLVFTAQRTGQYLVDAMSYANDEGGYQLSVERDGYSVPLLAIERSVSPTLPGASFYTPAQDEVDWVHTQSGTLEMDMPFETWTVPVNAGASVRIDLALVAPHPKDRDDLVEPFLYLLDESGNLLQTDADSGSGRTSRIYHSPMADGFVHVVVSTVGTYDEHNWNTFIGHYELVVEAKSTFDFIVTEHPLINPDAIKVNAIFVTDDQTLNDVPADYETMVSWVDQLNSVMATVYPAENWPAMEVASTIAYYDPVYAVTNNTHGALADLGSSPVARQDHLNLVILVSDQNNGDSGTYSAGVTYPWQFITAFRGATIVVNKNDGVPVLIHEFCHVIGIGDHIAGSWPPRTFTLDTGDDPPMGFWGFNHSGPESNYFNGWNSFIWPAYTASWHLTKQPTALNTPTLRHLFAEAFRRWLIENQVIDSDAPPTDYMGPSSGDGDASELWVWTDPSTEHLVEEGIYPSSDAAHAPGVKAAAVITSDPGGGALYLRYRNSNGTWHETEQRSPGQEALRENRMAVDTSGNALAAWSLWYAGDISVSYHAHDGQVWTQTEILSRPITSAGGYTDHPTVILNDQGMGAAAWLRYESGGGGYEVVSRFRNPNGIWSAHEIHHQSTEGLGLPELATNSAGDLWLVWQRLEDEIFTVYGRFWNAATASWGDVEKYSSGLSPAGFAQPVLRADGSGVVAWRQGDLSNEGPPATAHIAARVRDVNGSLSSIEVVSSAGEDSFNTSLEGRKINILVDENDRVGVAWSAFDGNSYRVNAALMDTQGDWSAPQVISAEGQHAKMPSLAVGGHRWAVSWQRSDGYRSRVQASVLAPDGTWSVPESLSPAGRMGIWSELSASGEDGFTLIWAESEGGNYRLRSREATLVIP